MLAISILISASSSTIRMSCAMADRTQLRWRLAYDRTVYGLRLAGKHEFHPSPASRAIRQDELSRVIFHDLFHDGEAQPGSLCSGRDIRLGQALAPVRRQALAVVFHRDRHLRPGFDNHDNM